MPKPQKAPAKDTQNRNAEPDRREGVLDVLNNLQRSYTQKGWAGLPFHQALQSLLDLSDSAFGFLTFRSVVAEQDPEWLIFGFASRTPDLTRFEDFWLDHPDASWMSVVSSLEPVNLLAPGDSIRSPLPVAVTSFLGLPIRGSKGVTGVLALFNRHNGFDSAWQSLLTPLCSTLALMHELECGLQREAQLRHELQKWSYLFSVTVESIGGCVIATDLQGRINYMNPTAQRTLGATFPEQAVAVNLAAFHDPAEFQEVRAAYSLAHGCAPQNDFQLLVQGALEGRARREWTYVSLMGSRHPMRVTLSPLHEQGTEVTGWVAVATDLSEFHATQADQLRTSQLENQLEILCRREIEAAKISEAYEYVAASRSLREALGVISAFLPVIFGAAAPILLIPRAGARAEFRESECAASDFINVDASECWGLKTGQVFVSEPGSLRCKHIRDEHSIWVCAPLADGQRTVAVLSTPLPDGPTHSTEGAGQERHRRLSSLSDQARRFSSVLANLRLKKILEEQATRDPLTGAINRRQLDHELRITLHRHQKTGAPFAVMLLDLDHFKHINDNFGHERGDQVLAGLGALLLKRLRTTDVVARVGGEEFLILLREAAPQDALDLAHALREAIETAHLAGENVACTCSIGLVHVKNLESPIEELLKLADDALYQAKTGGRNRVVFIPDLHAPSGTTHPRGGQNPPDAEARHGSPAPALSMEV